MCLTGSCVAPPHTWEPYSLGSIENCSIIPIRNGMLVSNPRTLPIGSSPCVAVAVPWVVCLELSKRIPWSIWNLAQSVSTVTWESMRRFDALRPASPCEGDDDTGDDNDGSYWQVYTSYAAMCSSKIVLLHQDLRRILSKRLWRMMWNRIEVIAVPSCPKSSFVFKRVSLKFKPTSFFSSFSSYMAEETKVVIPYPALFGWRFTTKPMKAWCVLCVGSG